MREILLAEKWKQNITSIIIASKDINLDAFGLTTPEKDYIASLLSKKERCVHLNRYNHWLIFQYAEEKSSDFAINEAFRNSACRIHKTLAKEKITEIQIIDAAEEASHAKAFLEGLCLSNYQFTKYFSNKAERDFGISKITLVSTRISQTEADELNTLVKAVWWARDLINEPASFLTSTQLSKEFEKMGQEAGFKTEVFDKAKIESLQMGGILAVNKGSAEPPTFTVMTWKPGTAVNTKPYILVGKGVVYDSGGLSLKPTPDSMDYMKCDMAGAAAVAATMYALAKNDVPAYVIAIAPSTDNRLDSHSYSPGDVITMYGGKTVEVLNTDAEGRLILADALEYARQFEPELTMTIATLTGAAHRAIGELGMAGMGNADNATFEKLEKAGWEVYERIARLPFWEEYGDMIKSDIADLKNIGGDVAGAITAGKFLEHFTSGPFIHLDIAGPSFSKKGRSYHGKGGSGVGVRLLYNFLKNQSSK